MKQLLRFRGCYCSNSKRPLTHKTIIISLLLASSIQFAQGQPSSAIRIAGTVLSAETGQPLVGASIKVTGIGGALPKTPDTQTDAEGTFALHTSLTEGIIQVSFIGHQTQTVQFSPAATSPFTISLEKDENVLEEVEVNTGFQHIPKERATGSFVHIDNELLSRSVGSNILERLDGVTRGLTFNDAQMGETRLNNQPAMSIRGRSTLFANAEPLIILDNFPYEGDINSINPEDIASVTLLQDAAATSIWGARAGNGVIVLTSKKGRFEQPLKITFRGDLSRSGKPDLHYTPTMPMKDLIEVERMLFTRGAWDGTILQGFPYVTPAIEVLAHHRDGMVNDTELEALLDQMKSQDVRNDLGRYVYRPSALYKAALNLQGGSGHNNYYLSAGYDRNLHNQYNNHRQRISLNARNSYRMLQGQMELDAAVLFAKSTGHRGHTPQYRVLYDRLADDSGRPLSVGGGMDFRQGYIDTAGGGLLADWNYRPLDELYLGGFSDNGTTYQLNTGLLYKPLTWLTASVQYQYGHGNSETERYDDPESFTVRNDINRFSRINAVSGTVTSAIPAGGRLNTVNDRYFIHHLRGQLAFQKEWGDGQALNGIAGAELNNRQTLQGVSGTWIGYNPDTETHTPFDFNSRHPLYHTGAMATLLVTPTVPSRLTGIGRNLLYFSNVSYVLHRRYTATLSLRKDAANIFGADANRRGMPFWSAGFRWQVDQEPFYSEGWLPHLAARITYGYSGNVGRGSSYITSSVAASPYSFTGLMYQVIGNPPNPQLGWETVKMLNAGVDFAIKGNRLRGTVELYRKRAVDLLSDAPMNPSSGVNSLYGNWSSLKGHGLDMQLNSVNVKGAISWLTDILFSYTKDEVTEYKLRPARDTDYLRSANGLGQYPIEGRPMYSIFSLPYAGLDGDGLPQGYQAGEISQDYVNIYSQTPLDEFIYHGRATPAVFGSFRNTFRYKMVELSCNISYQLGYYFRRSGMSYAGLYNPGQYTRAAFYGDYTNRWQRPGDERHTHVPAAQYPANATWESFYALSSVLVERGDHVRLKDVRVSYSLPAAVERPLGIRSAELYVYASNLGILWRANRLGIDPEMVPGFTLAFPAPANYALGITIQL